MTLPVRTGAGNGRPWPVALLLGSGSFLVLFDSLAIATALPSIGAAFALPPGVLQWVVSLNSIGIGAFLVLGGRVSDLVGRRRVLVASLVLCTGAGLATGLAPDLPVLLVGRLLQGIAAAFALPAALLTAATLFPAEPWRSRVFSVMAFAAWSAGLAGAMLGGLITVHVSWRWVFLVTVPVGAIAVVVAVLRLPPDPPRHEPAARLDVWGAVLASTGLVVVILGIQAFGDSATRGRAVLVGCAGLTLLAGLVLVERRAPHPLVRPGLLRSRRMLGSCLAFGAFCVGYTAVVVIGSRYLQVVHGLSAVAAGLALSPVLVGGIVSSLLAPLVLRRFTTRAVLAVCLVVCAVALTLIALRGAAGVAALLPWLLLWGIASGPIYVGFARECVGDTSETDRGTASALYESMAHVGGAVAIAVDLTLIGAGLGYAVTELISVVVVAAGAVLTFSLLPHTGPPR